LSKEGQITRDDKRRVAELAEDNGNHIVLDLSGLWGAVRGMLRYYEFVELARVCWRQSQTAYTQETARTLRRIAREYLQEAAKLDGGNIPDIGLVCLKEARQRQGRGASSRHAGRMDG
jgi:hypothetical protein